jgi:alpha-1,2-mannosyltransferase
LPAITNAWRGRLAWATRTEARVGFATFVLVALVYVPTASLAQAWNSDVQAAIVPAVSLAQTGLPWLEYLPLPDNPFFIQAGDHVVSNRPIGISLLAVPIYVLSGAPYDEWPSAVAAALATALAVSLMHLALRRLVPAGAAAAATAVFAFGTPTWTVSADGLWGHTATQLAISSGVFFASRGRWWLVGVAIGLGALARPHLVAVAFLVGLTLGLRSRSIRPILAIGVPSTVGLLIVISVNRWMLGQWAVSGYGSYPTANLTQADAWTLVDSAVNVAGFLFSPGRGLFVWTPVLLILLPSAIRAARSAPSWVIAFALGGVAYSLVQLRINWFHGVDTFYGYRHALELLTCCLPLFTIAWTRVVDRRLRGLVAGLAAIQLAAMAVGAFASRGFIAMTEVWRDNDLLWLLRQNPLLLAAAIALFAWLGVRTGVDVARRSGSDSVPTAENVTRTADCSNRRVAVPDANTRVQTTDSPREGDPRRPPE